MASQCIQTARFVPTNCTLAGMPARHKEFLMTAPATRTVTGQQIDIPAAGGVIDAWLFLPRPSGRWPLVILHTDIKGVRQTFVEHGRKLAAHGYAVVLPNLYYRSGRAPVIDPGASLADEQTRARLAELRNSLGCEAIRADHEAIFECLASNAGVDETRVGIVGYCMSGAIALHAAADFPHVIKAAASFHGGRLATDTSDSPHLRAAGINARLYLGYAHEDASMTQDQIATLQQALRNADVPFSSDHYAARHGFAVADSPSYDAAAAGLHWQRLTALLHDALK
jgi:carboxymethylenebutenolidase